MSHDSYVSPLSGRYASKPMQALFSDDKKFGTWRGLWIILAQSQQTLGLHITDEQIAEMEAQQGNIDYKRVAVLEKEVRHDVMAHILAYREVAPLAGPIIHLGATSCYVTDNTDLIQMKEGLKLLCVGLARVMKRVRDFAHAYRALPTLGYTHFQPASLVTVGKRAAMWLFDLLLDLRALEAQHDALLFLGVKGATGTQDTFMHLFDGDHEKVKRLDKMVTAACAFSRSVPISGQTYTRKQDTRVIAALADFSATANKIGNDLRLLQHDKEVEEPFGEKQVGSTAMVYKHNPMRSERDCSLARELTCDSTKPLLTHGLQWLERTLDDSAGRRRYIAESFLLADSLLRILQNIFEGLVVYPKVIRRRINAELPFMATEQIIMAMVKEGAADRQECHEKLRQHSQAAGRIVKEEGGDNDLLDRLRQDPYFAPVYARLTSVLDPARFIGRAPEQVDEFLVECDGALRPYEDDLHGRSELSV